MIGVSVADVVISFTKFILKLAIRIESDLCWCQFDAFGIKVVFISIPIWIVTNIWAVPKYTPEPYVFSLKASQV